MLLQIFLQHAIHTFDTISNVIITMAHAILFLPSISQLLMRSVTKYTFFTVCCFVHVAFYGIGNKRLVFCCTWSFEFQGSAIFPFQPYWNCWFVLHTFCIFLKLAIQSHSEKIISCPFFLICLHQLYSLKNMHYLTSTILTDPNDYLSVTHEVFFAQFQYDLEQL